MQYNKNLFWACALIFTTSAASADDADTNNWALQYVPKDSLLVRPESHETFWDDVFARLWRDQTLENRLGLVSHYSLFRIENLAKYHYRDYFINRGRDSVIDSLENAAGDAAANRVSYEAVEEWVLGDSAFGHFVDRLVYGSIGNSRERELEFVTATPNVTEIEETWMRQTVKSLKLDYGVRWSYGYVSADFGHQPGGKPIVHTDLRLAIGIPSLRMNSTNYTRIAKLEARLVFPLPANIQLTIDGRLYPGEYIYPRGFNSLDYSPAVSVRLEHVFGYGNLHGIASLGYSAGPHETLIAGQISFPLDILNRRYVSR